MGSEMHSPRKGNGPPSAEFPSFSDGDVHVHIAPNHQYTLHSSTLRRGSGHFWDMLRPENAVKLSPAARKEGVKTTFRVDLLTPDECKKRKRPPPDHNGVGYLALRVSNLA